MQITAFVPFKSSCEIWREWNELLSESVPMTSLSLSWLPLSFFIARWKSSLRIILFSIKYEADINDTELMVDILFWVVSRVIAFLKDWNEHWLPGPHSLKSSSWLHSNLNLRKSSAWQVEWTSSAEKIVTYRCQ